MSILETGEIQMGDKSYNYKGYKYSIPSNLNNLSKGITVYVITPSGESRMMIIYCNKKEDLHSFCQKAIDNYHRSQTYDLHCDFDVEKHKKTYINYLEVIIMPTGKVSYAVPSHQVKLESIACHKFGVEKEELSNMCPRERWLDYNDWLMEVTGCIMVWTNFYLGKANEYQIDKLEELKKAGVYIGDLSSGFEKKTIK